jgi:hypothetical protein
LSVSLLWFALCFAMKRGRRNPGLR